MSNLRGNEVERDKFNEDALLAHSLRLMDLHLTMRDVCAGLTQTGKARQAIEPRPS